MFHESQSRTVKIPVKIENGYPCLFPKGRLPALKDGTIGDLVVAAHAFEDPKIAAQFAEERTEHFLPAETELLAQINPEHVPEKYRQAFEFGLTGLVGAAVRFILCQDQQLLRRGTKNAELLPCRCSIPLIEEEAKSINHAYTLISQVYEPHRMSHTGNVFAKVWYMTNNRWKPLKSLRGH